ncbi:MAG: long-chain-acyl-CoA synthetase [Venatoribacter sp.]
MSNASVNSTAREVSLVNVIRGALGILPDIGPALKGIAALVTTKPEKLNSIGLLLEKHAAATPNNVAIHYQNEKVTYKELNERANQISHHLTAIGIKSGDTVGIFFENRPEDLVAVMATVKLGAIAGMLNTSQRGDVLEHSLNLIKAKAILVGEEMLDNLATVADRLSNDLKDRIYYVADEGKVPCPPQYKDLSEAIAKQPKTNPDSTAKVQMFQPCYYIFTSGTTGLPKASVMTHYRWFKSMAGMGLASMRMRSDDILYVSLPLYHNNALTVSMAAVLGAGAGVAIARKFSVSRFWDDIRHYDATAFCYIGELCRYLLNTKETNQDQNHRVRTIIGNGLRNDIWMEFKQRFNIPHINEFYGASECNLVFTNALNLDKTAGICPLSYDIVQYDIENDEPVRNAKGFMISIKKGQTGLLITEINDKQPFDGYTDEEATNKKVFRNVFKQGDAWFNTGDLVFNQGFKHVAFADRLGDTFRWKGENVATTEVESMLMDFDGIEHAVAYGVEVPNTDGRAGMASITLKVGTELDFKALTEHLREKLPVYAIPLFLRIREQEEITGTFKYRKVELKEEAYHLAKVSEPIYILTGKDAHYELMNATHETAINNGSLSL